MAKNCIFQLVKSKNMLKNLLFTLLLFTCFVSYTLGQGCIPDNKFTGLGVGVYPYPDTVGSDPADSLGIWQDACQGEQYYFIFTVVVPDSINIPGGAAPIRANLNNIRVDSITGAPMGIEYLCNPDTTCNFPDQSTGCAVLYGTTNDPVGNYPITVHATVSVNALGVPLTVPLKFPDTDSTGVLPTGDFSINVVAAPCSAILPPPGWNDLIDDGALTFLEVKNQPNPFSNKTNITYGLASRKVTTINVTSIIGELVYTNQMQGIGGINTFEFDGSQLSEGIYLYTLTDGRNTLTKRMIIQR